MNPLPLPPRGRPSQTLAQTLALTLILAGLLGTAAPAGAKVTEDILKLPVTVRSSCTLFWPAAVPLVSGMVNVTPSLVPVIVTVSVVVLVSPSESVMV